MAREFWVSVGTSRFDTKWKNKKMTWSQLATRLEAVTRTQETQAEYMAMNKTDQDNIKDVGGFVLGMLNNGRRSAQTVKLRSALTLDADYGEPGLMEEIEMLLDAACIIYTTHKHTPRNPRFRLIIPLDRDVTPEEYECIARAVADDIGIEYFDDTTYQPSRLMYFPSASRDAEYICRKIEGRMLRADEILGRYPDWHDMSCWAVSSRVQAVRRSAAERQKDPREKPGIIGAFCRTYDIPEAIEAFLSDVYVPCDNTSDRYTYQGGSTSGGLVVYEDGVFAYSNHNTDPASGHLCNAFDLVRMHYYLDKDINAKADTLPTQLPSYKAMLEFASNDAETKKTLSAEKIESARHMFDGSGISEEIENEAFDIDSKGNIAGTIHNAVLALKKDEAFRGIRQNMLRDAIDIDSRLPWGKAHGTWDDSDDVQLRAYLEPIAKFSKQVSTDGLLKYANDRQYHPIKDYFSSLPVWDGIIRVETVLIDYLGAEDSLYTRAVTRKTLVAAVKRIYEPGCKFDTMLVLRGEQGIGKSTLVAKLGMKWFSDSIILNDILTKTAQEKMQGFWILEIGELAGIDRADDNVLKGFLSSVADNYRAAYARHTKERKRSCIFIGTTNAEGGYLRDVTGGRRYWDVYVSGECKYRPWQMTQATVDQIWAEAYMLYDLDGEDLILEGDLAEEAKEKQTAQLLKSDYQGVVQEYLEQLLPEDWYERTPAQRLNWLNMDNLRKEEEGTLRRDIICATEIAYECLGKPWGEVSRQTSGEISRIMKTIGGWKKLPKTKRIKGYGSVKCYVREGSDADA